MSRKSKKQELNIQEESTYTYEDTRKALDALEAKVDELANAVERKFANAGQKTPIKKSNVKVVEMPSEDIVVDTHDKYNTQPQNFVGHHFFQNYKMFSRDAKKNVFQSKMFWILLVMLPMIMTFIEYVLTGWGVTNNTVFANGLTKVTTDMLNYLMLMPMLLLSLIIFPTFIASARETNQLKRYTMKGMSRKQIYYSYIIFSTLFLFAFIIIWMGPWILILNKANNSIWGGTADNPVFSNPWGILFGMNYNEAHIVSSFTSQNVADLLNNAAAVQNIEGWTEITAQQVTTAFNNIDTSDLSSVREQIEEICTTLNISIGDKCFDEFASYFNDGSQVTIVEISEGNLYFTFDKSFKISAPSYYNGADTIKFLFIFILVSFGINSVGFNKSMKVGSSKALMGWGIGLWIFSSVIQGTAGLLYKDIYTLRIDDKVVWTIVVIILMFILKWMFLFSPVTIMMVGISFTTGLVAEPEISSQFLIDNFDLISTFNDWLASQLNSGTVLLNDLWKTIDTILASTYNPLINPGMITKIFYTLSAVWALLWIFKTWAFKVKIVSYEAAR